MSSQSDGGAAKGLVAALAALQGQTSCDITPEQRGGAMRDGSRGHPPTCNPDPALSG
jgi:hypothetical protein